MRDRIFGCPTCQAMYCRLKKIEEIEFESPRDEKLVYELLEDLKQELDQDDYDSQH